MSTKKTRGSSDNDAMGLESDRLIVRRHSHGIRLNDRRVMASLVLGCLTWANPSWAAELSLERLADQYGTDIRPLVQRYCLDCHSAEKMKGDVNLERFTTAGAVRTDTRLWQKVMRQLREGEMPPEKKAQPSVEERNQLIAWVDQFLAADARKRAGDPGLVLMRRLTNTEYNHTIRDLTGVDLRPTRRFPEDSVAGEGFANTGEVLIMAPALLPKYLEAARKVSARAVLTPSGFRFSIMDDRHNWIAEAISRVQAFYARYADAKGRVPLHRYLEATLRYRECASTKNLSLDEFAAPQDLSAKYLRTLWQVFHDPQSDPDVALIAQRWSRLKSGEAQQLVDEIAGRQGKLWKFNDQRSWIIGSIGMYGSYVVPLQDQSNQTQTEANNGPTSPTSFSALFPLAVCFPQVVPVNDDVTVELTLREDEALRRLMLDEQEIQKLDRLWEELLFISRAPADEAYNMREFIGFQPADRHANNDKLALRIPALDQRAAEFETAVTDAEPKHLDAVVEFASRSWRRPLETGEETELRQLYQTLREDRSLLHDQAIRTVLTRILVSPRFLYRVERPIPGEKAVPVSDWELASRLSYFLGSTLPDKELWSLAAKGMLQDAEVLARQTLRMLGGPSAKALTVEFAGQWLQFRGFDEYSDKSETRFPTFTPALRRAMNEESIRFIANLILNDRSVLEIIQADHTFLNEELAKHYNIPDVKGSDWRRVDGMSRYGRGGVLAMGSVLAKQSGALRTSPVLRGTWVVETLLGRELPNPPDNVPQLVEDEVNKDGLTMRQLVERHRNEASCAACHQKIDPYGFALEAYDPIGRHRTKDLNGNPIDAQADPKDGPAFEGLSGLQQYLLAHEDEFLHQFCRKLLGYALGRTVELSDEPLLTEMRKQLESNQYRFSAAVLTIVNSNQFRRHRGQTPQQESSL